MCYILIDLCMSRFFYTDQFDCSLVDWCCRNCIDLSCFSEFDGFHDPVNCHLSCKCLNFSPLDRICIVIARLNDIYGSEFIFCFRWIFYLIVFQFFSKNLCSSVHDRDTSYYKRTTTVVDFFAQHCSYYDLRSDTCRISHCDCCNWFILCTHNLLFSFRLFLFMFSF